MDNNLSPFVLFRMPLSTNANHGVKLIQIAKIWLKLPQPGCHPEATRHQKSGDQAGMNTACH